MRFGQMISNLVFGPLKLLFEVIFSLSNRVLSTGFSIIVLSVVVNILVLPLYKRADAMQDEERSTEDRLAPVIRHIKSSFKGDEQVMILQAYYRENHYSPLHALKGALPLLLQVPFFIAAYQFLSHLGALQHASFGPIQDLSLPDRLLKLGGLSLNILPILMTVINLISGAIYTRGAPLKSKLQLVGMALLFLVLLYDSPAGLTFYWTLNNVFSLGKNLIQMYCTLPHKLTSSRWHHTPRKAPKLLSGSPQPGLFFLFALLLALLTGALIPSAVYAASTSEFIFSLDDPNPVWHVVNALLLSCGTFILWGGIFYALGSHPVRRGMETCLWMLLGIFLVDYLFFHNNMGTISVSLVYDMPPAFSMAQKLLNLVLVLATACILHLLLTKKEKLVRGLALTLALGIGGLSFNNIVTIQSSARAAYQAMGRNYSGVKEIPLSRSGKNVVVLMLDRAISSYIPVIMAEKPELKDIFSGFVYYPNTLSFGMHTNFGAPALFGGYEYTPKAMNARSEKSLKEKHNESLLLMPTLFSQENYQISLFDLPYVGDYSETDDYTLFDSLPNTNARIIHQSPYESNVWERNDDVLQRNTFCYSITVSSPSILFGSLYNMGHYNRASNTPSLFTMHDTTSYYYKNVSVTPEFMVDYDVLVRMGEMTRIQENGNTFLMMVNNTTHHPVLLQTPDYVPGNEPANDEYDAAHTNRFLAGPIPLSCINDFQMAHYHINMASILLLGNWLQELKAQGVYDNTRIILVADHGFNLEQIAEGLLEESREDIMGYNPLLMLKDFEADGALRTDTTFMTNADVPSLAMADLIENPVNPFTGNPVTNQEKAKPQYVTTSREYSIEKNNGNTFQPASWYRVSPGGNSLFDQSRWTWLPEKK